MTEPEFKPWPKISRYNRDIVITEKIDGTNGAIHIAAVDPMESQDEWVGAGFVGGVLYAVGAQSRKRIVHLGDNHFGFAQWASENAQALVETLGEGTHFGEWWGRKIARAYDQTDRTFSLFNTSRWRMADTRLVPGLSVVPVLYEGPMSQNAINDAQHDLRLKGSSAAPGFMRPEGIVIYHTAANVMFKITLENDEVPKGKNA